MKADELMVGDWIADKDGDEVRVVNIITEEIESTYYGIDTNLGWTVPFEEAQPIPLTAEILINNGFEHNETTYWGERYSLVYQRNGVNYNEIFELVPSYGELDEELDYMWFPASSAIPALVIKYVHELQHAMRLCGIKKEIGL